MNSQPKQNNEERDSLLEKYTILEQDLHDLEKYVSDLNIFVPIPLCYVNVLNIIMSVNKSFVKFTGFAENEVIGEPLTKLVEQEKADWIIEEVKKKTEIESTELKLNSKKDGQIPVNVSVMPRLTEEGMVIGFFISFYDLSSIKTMQKKMQKQIIELEKFNKIAVGRELKMIELKKLNKKLENNLKKYAQ